jgi:hypothetical protein
VDITGTDLTTADALRFAIDQYDINIAMWKSFVLATISNTGGVYTIRQYHRGSIKINPPFTDSLSSTTIGSDLHKTRSITTQADYGAGSMTLYGFKAGSAISPTPDITETGFRFLVRRLVSGIVTLQYLSGESLTSIIEDVIEDNPPAYPSPPDNEGWSGWWDDEWETKSPADLPDIAGGSAGDDHVDEDRGGLEGSTSVSYLDLDGGPGRNTFSAGAEIGSANGDAAIIPNSRTLNNGASVTLDWTAQSAAIADVPTAGSATAADNATAINAILAALRAYKIIAT